MVLEGVSNADNVGGVFRNAAAFGADGVLLSPTCCDPLYRKAIRTSMAATLRVPFARAGADDWPGALTSVKAAGFTIVALTPRQPSETLAAFTSRPRPARIALLVGTEGDGLTPEAEAAADYRVRIPIAGGIDSLNLAVATGIALYSLNREGYPDHEDTKITKVHEEGVLEDHPRITRMTRLDSEPARLPPAARRSRAHECKRRECEPLVPVARIHAACVSS